MISFLPATWLVGFDAMPHMASRFFDFNLCSQKRNHRHYSLLKHWDVLDQVQPLMDVVLITCLIHVNGGILTVPGVWNSTNNSNILLPQSVFLNLTIPCALQQRPPVRLTGIKTGTFWLRFFPKGYSCPWDMKQVPLTK